MSGTRLSYEMNLMVDRQELEDEVMTLRGQLQAMTNDRDGWLRAAVVSENELMLVAADRARLQSTLDTVAREQSLLLEKVYADRDFHKAEAAKWRDAYHGMSGPAEG